MKKICVITGTRAEFGLMRAMLDGLKAAPDVTLQLIVTGAHLVAGHGNTHEEIRAGGFPIDAEVDMLLASDSPRAVGQSMGLGVIGLTTALARLAPDMVVLLGDRYEALAAAQSAMILRIPIAHTAAECGLLFARRGILARDGGFPVNLSGSVLTCRP